MINHPSSWQAHLQRISDFLLPGKGVWRNENDNGEATFFYAKANPVSLEVGPVLHHFRSSSFKSEEVQLKQCWLKCLELKIDLPIHRLQIENENGNLVTVHYNSNVLDDDSLSGEVMACDELPCERSVTLDRDCYTG